MAATEKTWIAQQLQQIETLPVQLDRFFQHGDGEHACRDCLGGYGAKGHSYLPLINLLRFPATRSIAATAWFFTDLPVSFHFGLSAASDQSTLQLD